MKVTVIQQAPLYKKVIRVSISSSCKTGQGHILNHNSLTFINHLNKFSEHSQFTWGIGVWHDHSNIKIKGGKLMGWLFPDHYEE